MTKQGRRANPKNLLPFLSALIALQGFAIMPASAQCIIPGSEGCVGEAPTGGATGDEPTGSSAQEDDPINGGEVSPARKYDLELIEGTLFIAVWEGADDLVGATFMSLSSYYEDDFGRMDIDETPSIGISPPIFDALDSLSSRAEQSPHPGGTVTGSGTVQNFVKSAAEAALGMMDYASENAVEDQYFQPTQDSLEDAALGSVEDADKADRTFPSMDPDLESPSALADKQRRMQMAAELTGLPLLALLARRNGEFAEGPESDPKGEKFSDAEEDPTKRTIKPVIPGPNVKSKEEYSPGITKLIHEVIQEGLEETMDTVREAAEEGDFTAFDMDSIEESVPEAEPLQRTAAAAKSGQAKILMMLTERSQAGFLGTYAGAPEDSPLTTLGSEGLVADAELRSYLEQNDDQITTPFYLSAASFESTKNAAGLFFTLDGGLFLRAKGKGYVFEPVAFDQAEISSAFQDFGASSFEDKGAQLRINDENGQLLLSAQFDFLGFEATDSTELSWSWPAEGDESDLDYTLEVNYSAGIKQRLQPAIALPKFDLAAAEKFNLLTLVDRTDGSVVMNGQRFRPAYTVNALTSGQNAYAKKVGGSQNVAFMEGDVNGDGKMDYTLYMADIGSQVLYGL